MTEATKQNTPVLITAIIAVTLLELYAISKGINGTVLTLVIGAVAALAGAKIGKTLEHRQIEKIEKENKEI